MVRAIQNSAWRSVSRSLSNARCPTPKRIKMPVITSNINPMVMIDASKFVDFGCSMSRKMQEQCVEFLAEIGVVFETQGCYNKNSKRKRRKRMKKWILPSLILSILALMAGMTLFGPMIIEDANTLRIESENRT